MHQDYTRMRTNGTGKHTRADIVHVHVCTTERYTMAVETYIAQALGNDKFDRVSYFITPFNQKGIYKWEPKCVESVFN
jgi:hypothetical protein